MVGLAVKAAAWGSFLVAWSVGDRNHIVSRARVRSSRVVGMGALVVDRLPDTERSRRVVVILLVGVSWVVCLAMAR